MKSAREDSVMTSSRREAALVLLIWLAVMTYTVAYCVWRGYGREWSTVTFVLGFPDWVFWGIIFPWLACVALSWWFAYRFMTDEPLGEGVVAESPLNSHEDSSDV